MPEEQDEARYTLTKDEYTFLQDEIQKRKIMGKFAKWIRDGCTLVIAVGAAYVLLADGIKNFFKTLGH